MSDRFALLAAMVVCLAASPLLADPPIRQSAERPRPALPQGTAEFLADIKEDLNRGAAKAPLYTRDDFVAELRGEDRPPIPPPMEGPTRWQPPVHLASGRHDRPTDPKRLLLETAFQLETLAHELDLADLADSADELRAAAGKLREKARAGKPRPAIHQGPLRSAPSQMQFPGPSRYFQRDQPSEPPKRINPSRHSGPPKEAP